MTDKHSPGPFTIEWVGTCQRVTDADGMSWNPRHVPHDCTVNQCPGGENKRKLDAFPLMLDALLHLIADPEVTGHCLIVDYEAAEAAIRAATGEEA